MLQVGTLDMNYQMLVFLSKSDVDAPQLNVQEMQFHALLLYLILLIIGVFLDLGTKKNHLVVSTKNNLHQNIIIKKIPAPKLIIILWVAVIPKLSLFICSNYEHTYVFFIPIFYACDQLFDYKSL